MRWLYRLWQAMSFASGSKNDRSFEDKVGIYKRFYHDKISRDEAKEQIGDDWHEVAQVATMELCREEQQQPTDAEIREAFNN